MTLSSPKANTAKATTQDRSSGVNDQFAPHTTDSSGENAVAGGQDVSMALPHKESSPSLDPLLLLLVDDNVSTLILDSSTALTSLQPINLKLLSMVADRNNYPWLLATNGQEAVDAYISPQETSKSTKQEHKTRAHIPDRRPDVVLLDLNMPVMNGFEAARQIRQFEKQTGATPAVIIAITGLGDDIARAKAYQHGFDFFMSKPVRPKDVTDMLESIIQSKSKEG